MENTEIKNNIRHEDPSFDLRSYYNGSEEYWKKQLPSWPFNRVFFYDDVREFPDTYTEIIEGTDKDGNQLVRHEQFNGVEFQRGTNLDAVSLGTMDQNIYMLALGFKDLLEKYNELAMKLSISQGILLNNMPYNRFVKSMKITADFKVICGWHSPEGGWVAC